MAPLRPAMPVADLLERWAYRDQRYKRRRGGLTDDEIESVRASRQIELAYVHPHERREAYSYLMRWLPPVGRRQ